MRKKIKLLLFINLFIILFVGCNHQDASDIYSKETYADNYVSFEYNNDLFTITPSEDELTLSIKIPEMPEPSEGMPNTVMGFVTTPNEHVYELSENDAKEMLKLTVEMVCKNTFELNDDESIVSESKKWLSDFSIEYCVETNDSSVCYVKILNYNSYITMAILRVCKYSEPYNDAFIDIYNSVESKLGNYNFNDSSLVVTPSPEISTPTPILLFTPMPDSSEKEENKEVSPSSSIPTATPVPDNLNNNIPNSNNTENITSDATLEQQNALNKAQRYLKALSFSYQGLIGQLEYDKFSHEAAVYAADNCGADWNEQALNKANSYLKSLSFSYQGLIKQLEYDKFTNEQATYGADNCGADWNEQAAKKAASYMKVLSFSRDELINQLKYDGFTASQASYGADSVGY